MRRVRWAIIGVGLAAYWTAVGHEVMSARQATRDRYLGFEWIAAGALTLPWSCLSDVPPKQAPPDERALLTGVNVGGAAVNGLLFAVLVLWLTRARGPRSQAA